MAFTAFKSLGIAVCIGVLFYKNSAQTEESFSTNSLQLSATSSTQYMPQMHYSGRIQTDVSASRMMRDGASWRDNIGIRRMELKLEQEWSEHLRSAIGFKITQQLRKNGRSDVEHSEIEEWLEQAYIEIREIADKPIAFIIGMQRVAWGQDLQKMPISDNNLFRPLSNDDQKQVVGITMVLEENIFHFLDKLEVSIFESDPSLSFGKVDGAAVRFSKTIANNVQTQLSFLHKGNGHDSRSKAEDRISLGLIYSNGDWTTWIEGIGFQNSNIYKDARYGFSAGAAKKLGARGEVIIEGTWIDRSLKQMGIGYIWKFSKNWSIGPEIRISSHEKNKNSENEFSAGFRLQYQFQKKSSANHNKTR